MRLHKSQISLAILRGLAFDLLFFARGQFCPKFIRDFLGQIRLDGEDVGQITIVIFRPYVLVILGVDQLHVHADPIADTPNTAFENGGNAQRLSDFANVRCLAPVGHNRCAGDYLQVADFR